MEFLLLCSPSHTLRELSHRQIADVVVVAAVEGKKATQTNDV